MNVRTASVAPHVFSGTKTRILLIVLACAVGPLAQAQDSAKADASIVGENDQPLPVVPLAVTPAERSHQAWKMLTDAEADVKHPQTRIQGLAAIGLLRTSQSEKMITDAMHDPDLDVRTAAALAAGESKDRNLTTGLRDLLDDKEPQVAFTAAVTLWKMGDKSGEDILMSVVDGERSASPTLMHGTEHKIGVDLHDPAKLAKLGAIQGAYMFLGPFGYGLTAFNFIHQSGGDLSRVTAIEQVSQERIQPVHQELIAALGDKDLAVRAAAAKALVDYHDKPTSDAVYALLDDLKQPVRLTGAAVYLRTMGTPGPPVIGSTTPSRSVR